MLTRAASSPAGANDPVCVTDMEQGVFHVSVAGDWTLALLERAYGTIEKAGSLPKDALSAKIDIGRLDMLDTAGALALVTLRGRLGSAEAASFVNARDEHRILLDEVI